MFRNHGNGASARSYIWNWEPKFVGLINILPTFTLDFTKGSNINIAML